MLKGGVVGTLMSNYGLEKYFKYNRIKFIRANVGSFDLNNGDKELQNALDGIKRIVLNEELFNDTSYEEFYGGVVATIDLLIETLETPPVSFTMPKTSVSGPEIFLISDSLIPIALLSSLTVTSKR